MKLHLSALCAFLMAALFYAARTVSAALLVAPLSAWNEDSWSHALAVVGRPLLMLCLLCLLTGIVLLIVELYITLKQQDANAIKTFFREHFSD